MNQIQMYSSSSQLRAGLHRALAVSYAMTESIVDESTLAWWEMLPAELQATAQVHGLSLEQLAELFEQAQILERLSEVRDLFGLPPLNHTQLKAAFRRAIINGRAHKAHMGRDVYGESNKALWDLVCGDFGEALAVRFGQAIGDEPVSSVESAPSGAALSVLRELSAFDTSPSGSDHAACVEWLLDRLSALGFSVSVRGADLGKPLIVAQRPSSGLEGHVVLYGHYDVTPFGRPERWQHPPQELTLAEGRLFARGVADNKGPLACRLAALTEMEAAPALTWLIQGEEETGSVVAHTLLPDIMGELEPTIWLDETGYHDHEDGTLRLLGRTVGPEDASLPPDPALQKLLHGLVALASRWGVASRYEQRGLNKSVVQGGCPFNRFLPEGARYLAIGVNDSKARIHGLNESIPGWTFPLHAAELDVIFRWVDATERGAL